MHAQWVSWCAGDREFHTLELSTIEGISLEGLQVHLHYTKEETGAPRAPRNPCKVIQGTSQLWLQPPTALLFFGYLTLLTSDASHLVQTSRVCTAHFCPVWSREACWEEGLLLPPGPQPQAIITPLDVINTF